MADTTNMELMKTVGYVDPELKEILSNSGPVASLGETTDIQALRATLKERKRAMTASAGPSTSTITETDHNIPTRDGAQIVVRTYKDHTKDVSGPVLVVLHGGGWVLGDLDNEALLCRSWCELVPGGVSVNVDYRLAPEYKFPIPVHDCHDAVKWVAANSGVHGGDLSKGFIVSGVSAGANMACSVAHLARDEHLSPPLTGVYLNIPSLLAPQAVPDKWKSVYTSRDENKDAPILNSGAIALFRKLYEDDPLSPLMSPAVWPSGHKALPPTYLQVAGMDPLRDEGLIYEETLMEAGVSTRMDVYPGLPHGFSSWWPKAEFSVKQRKDTVDGLKWLLEAGSGK